ncbi:hypothetical protein KSP40_PGU012490 [Platanthera guangdongensis]|uniref:peptide-methionine (S)-S-oxide reductase n=1 Tax=Platanthera guangdongensis TaxID=2320717 RepID=A0ABR2LME3_9ASPA
MARTLTLRTSAEGRTTKTPLDLGDCNTVLGDNGVKRSFIYKQRWGDVGTQYRSGIYFYSVEQEKAARESLERQEKSLGRKVVTEILPAKKYYRAEDYHQQYLEKGGRSGSKQSAFKGCSDPIRCYG